MLEANHQFGAALGRSHTRGATVGKLTFIEVYRHAAIAAAHAVLDLPATLAGEQKRLGVRIDAAPTLEAGDGLLDRLGADDDCGHWSRLLVSDADAEADPAGGTPGTYPERLKYVLLSPRARAETVLTQRQPGLIEAIVRDQRGNPAYDARLGQMLFQLMVPLDYKAQAREQARLLLVLDGYAARLPWELLQAEDEPLVINMPLVRQLATQRYRPALRTATSNSACLIAAPSTAGFDRRFGGDQPQLEALPQAAQEVQAVADSLRRLGWNDGDIVVSAPGREALDVLATLYARPYRVLAIAAHGVFEAAAIDQRRYSGVVLSDGLLITAVEIGMMEVVPELVFINCCHQGALNAAAQPDRLACSLARELIEMGVRCVVAAAWAVDDAAASTFAQTLFDALCAGTRFGEAVFAARRATYTQHPASNTWGAYQAYGDPGYRLNNADEAAIRHAGSPYVALDELLAAIAARRAPAAASDFAGQRQWVARQLARCPPHWSDDAQLLQAVGALYADCGRSGFAAARDAWQRALAADDAGGRVALGTLEKLATLEIDEAEALATGAQADAADLSTALLACAQARLDALAAQCGANAGRAALRERAQSCRTTLAARPAADTGS